MDEDSVEKLQTVNLDPATPLKMLVWRFRQFVRDTFETDIWDVTAGQKKRTNKVRQIYLKVDDFIATRLPGIQKEVSRTVACRRVYDTLTRELGYEMSDMDENRPWGAYYRIADEQADRFLKEFFPGLSGADAKLGRDDVVLSPKIMLVYPGQRLSWQYHARRGERWRFMTSGMYARSQSDAETEMTHAKPGQIVQFAVGERHRLGAIRTKYTIVAEIWQHTVANDPSDEDDIVRLQDDYARS